MICMNKHVVVIYPHPDDESFGAAGSILQFREEGIPVTYLCGTLGEMGRNMGKPNIASRETLPQVRKEELKRACEVLDINLEMLGYRDKTLEFEDRNMVALHLKEFLDKIQPHLVITHYPEHAVHPDHNALGAAAIQAVQMMEEGDRPEVWAQAITNDFLEVLGTPEVINDISKHSEKKMEAIFCHASQANGVLSQFKQRETLDPRIENEVQRRFSIEQFYIWKFTD